ncbi:hypothetical protein H0E87_023961, partial [Populus deltoides]
EREQTGKEDALGRLRHGNGGLNLGLCGGRAGVLSGFVGGRSGLVSSVGEGRVAWGREEVVARLQWLFWFSRFLPHERGTTDLNKERKAWLWFLVLGASKSKW